jgi:hypothetical protein
LALSSDRRAADLTTLDGDIRPTESEAIVDLPILPTIGRRGLVRRSVTRLMGGSA